MATGGHAPPPGAVRGLWVQPVPWECAQGVAVAVEAERDTGADEGHLPPVPPADASRADRRASSEDGRGGLLCLGEAPGSLARRGRAPGSQRPWGAGGAPSRWLRPVHPAPLNLRGPPRHLVLHLHRLPVRTPPASSTSDASRLTNREPELLAFLKPAPGLLCNPLPIKLGVFESISLILLCGFLEILPDPPILASTPSLQTRFLSVFKSRPFPPPPSHNPRSPLHPRVPWATESQGALGSVTSSHRLQGVWLAPEIPRRARDKGTCVPGDKAFVFT